MAYLRFNRYLDSLAVPVLFVLENGAMEAVMDISYSSVAGTEQNNIFEEYKREAYRLDSLRRCLHSHYVEQVEKRMMDAGLEQSMCDEDFRLSSQEEKLWPTGLFDGIIIHRLRYGCWNRCKAVSMKMSCEAFVGIRWAKQECADIVRYFFALA